MAICEVCGGEMTTEDGCLPATILCRGKEYKRIKAGDAHDFWPDMREGDRCHDCGATKGNYHHWGCDAERCPVCGGQLISCDCSARILVPREDEKR